MTNISTMPKHCCEARVDALYAEFGAVLAQRMIEAEAVDFLWEARIREHYRGHYSEVDMGSGDRADDLARIEIVSHLDRQWYRACCLVDGEGRAVGLLWKHILSEGEAALRSA